MTDEQDDKLHRSIVERIKAHRDRIPNRVAEKIAEIDPDHPALSDDPEQSVIEQIKARRAEQGTAAIPASVTPPTAPAPESVQPPPGLLHRMMDDATAQPIKTNKRGPYKKRAKAVPIKETDRGYNRYFQASYVVAMNGNLTATARGVYSWFEARMSHINPLYDVYELALSLEDIADGCCLSINALRDAIRELEAAEVIYVTQQGAHLPNSYTLPVKRARLRRLAEKQQEPNPDGEDPEIEDQ